MSKTKNKPGIQDEIWKDIPTYEGYYQVSNLGRVRSLDRFVKAPKGGFILKRSGVLAIAVSKTGYNRVHLCKEGGSDICALHRLVAIAFIPNPENKPCVNHKNGIKTDNTIYNLEWCTVKENNDHRLKVLGYKHSEDIKKRIREVSKEAAKKLRKPVKCLEDNIEFKSIGEAASHYGVRRDTIRVLLKNKSKSRLGKSFSFVSSNYLIKQQRHDQTHT